MVENQAIGIFDSGVGGLTVAAAIHKLLPSESFIYYGDTRHAPYGDKSKSTILDYSRRISRFLADSNCKAIVIACNSASASAYEELQAEWPHIPVINVVEPVVAEVARLKAEKVGLIATRATVQSGLYQRHLLNLAPQTQLVQKATPLLAPLVEEGFAGTDVSQGALNHYLKPLQSEALSHLILGCTHYPLLQGEINDFFQQQVEVLNSADLVAASLKTLLAEKNLLRSAPEKGSLQFYVSEKTEAFRDTAALFFGQEIELQEKLLPA